MPLSPENLNNSVGLNWPPPSPSHGYAGGGNARTATAIATSDSNANSTATSDNESDVGHGYRSPKFDKVNANINGNGNGNSNSNSNVSNSNSNKATNNSSETPDATAKSARSFWLSKMNQPKNTTSWKKNYGAGTSRGEDTDTGSAASAATSTATSTARSSHVGNPVGNPVGSAAVNTAATNTSSGSSARNTYTYASSSTRSKPMPITMLTTDGSTSTASGNHNNHNDNSRQKKRIQTPPTDKEMRSKEKQVKLSPPPPAPSPSSLYKKSTQSPPSRSSPVRASPAPQPEPQEQEQATSPSFRTSFQNIQRNLQKEIQKNSKRNNYSNNGNENTNANVGIARDDTRASNTKNNNSKKNNYSNASEKANENIGIAARDDTRASNTNTSMNASHRNTSQSSSSSKGANNCGNSNVNVNNSNNANNSNVNRNQKKNHDIAASSSSTAAYPNQNQNQKQALHTPMASTPSRSSKYHRRDDSFLKHHQERQQQQQQQHHQQEHPYAHARNAMSTPHKSTTAPSPSSISNTSTSQSQSQSLSQSQPHQDGEVGEMQIKLDIAAAKLLTEEMKFQNVQEQLQELDLVSNKRIRDLELQLEQQLQSQHIDQDQHSDRELELELERENWRQREQEFQLEQKEQKQEMEDLYSEIERLHESHRAERVLVQNQEEELKELLIKKEGELDGLRDSLEVVDIRKGGLEEELKVALASVANSASASASGNKDRNGGDDSEEIIEQQNRLLKEKEDALKYTMQELKEVKKEIGAITKDFKDLADETERLEIELEAVTEDRDELLRRSIVYNNEAQKQSKSQSPDRREKKALLESSRQEYDMEQHQAEVSRLRTALNDEESEGLMKDRMIRELEALVDGGGNKANAFELDLSVIDVENTSLFAEEKEARREIEERFNATQRECSRLNGEMDSLTQTLEESKNERDKLKDCLADAMNELEFHESNTKEKEDRAEAYAQQLMQVIKEKDVEIDQLTEQIASEARNSQYANTSADSFQEEVNDVVEWLNSSTRLNGSPSIEMTVRLPSENTKLIPQDEAMVMSIHRYIKNNQMKLQISEADLEIAKKLLSADGSSLLGEDNEFETSTEASFERGRVSSRNDSNFEIISIQMADEAVKRLRSYVKAARDDIQLHEKTNEELRRSLSEAADLIKPLNDHVLRIETDRLDLQSELASSTKHIMELEKVVSAAPGHASSSLSTASNLLSGLSFEDQSGQFVKISGFDLRKKDDEIVSLKVAVNQLKGELKEAESDVISATANGSSEDMPTPTKSNRGKDRALLRGSVSPSKRASPSKRTSASTSVQPTNEEDDTRTRLLNTEIETLKRDLKKKISAEETLKVILRDSSNRLTMMSTQAEQLAGEKNDAENRIRELEREKIDLQDRLQAQSHGNMGQNNELEALRKETESRNDQLSVHMLELKADLKVNNKERKKLKKSLSEAVGMLNALRSHVETSEKERKKVKKLLRSIHAKNEHQHQNQTHSSSPSPTRIGNLGTKIQTLTLSPDGAHIPDPDKIENETTILNLKSHIIEMEYEIRILEERIDEHELSRSRNNTTSADHKGGNNTHENHNQYQASVEIQIQQLKKQLVEAQNAYDSTSAMLEEVAEINKEMLDDLKQTENEAAETAHDLDELRTRYNNARSEIDDAKYVATFAIQKLDGRENEDPDVYVNMEHLPLADCINQLDRRVQALVKDNFMGRGDTNDDW